MQKQPPRSSLNSPEAETQQDTITMIGINDVLLGRGAMVDRNEGNVRFRSVIRKYKKQYSSCSQRPLKHKIAMKVYDLICSLNGRFLRRVVTARVSEDRLDDVIHENSSIGTSTAVSRNVQLPILETKISNIWESVDTGKALSKIKQALREQYDDDSSGEEDKVSTVGMEKGEEITLSTNSCSFASPEFFVSDRQSSSKSQNDDNLRRMAASFSENEDSRNNEISPSTLLQNQLSQNLLQHPTPSVSLHYHLIQLHKQKRMHHAQAGQQLQEDCAIIEHLKRAKLKSISRQEAAIQTIIHPSTLYSSAASLFIRENEQRDIILQQQVAKQLEVSRLQQQIDLQQQLVLLHQGLGNKRLPFLINNREIIPGSGSMIRPSLLLENLPSQYIGATPSNVSRANSDPSQGDYPGIRLPSNLSNPTLLNAPPNVQERSFMRHHSQEELSRLLLSRGDDAIINRRSNVDNSSKRSNAIEHHLASRKKKRSLEEDDAEKKSFSEKKPKSQKSSR